MKHRKNNQSDLFLGKNRSKIFISCVQKRLKTILPVKTGHLFERFSPKVAIENIYFYCVFGQNFKLRRSEKHLVGFISGFANDQLRLADYTENDEWDVITPVETNNVNNSNSIKSTVHLNLKRRHLFYSIFLISPTIILYLLSGLTFLLPPDSGEKVSFAVTILLAQIVSFGTLSGIFPTSSRNLPILAYFVLAVTVHMSLVCFVASMS